ncbi:MAG TPA: SGNH/GDSL hydrolase family protein [Vicinamibacterales bacterium]|nr:SGNH/GDSL hydrolase family protein [Vicinamibacterales bacterium]
MIPHKNVMGVLSVFACLLTATIPVNAQVPFVGMGDSIGEGVQSADASYATQPYSFLNLIAWRMGAPFPLPYILSDWLASISSVDQRPRFDPSVAGLNLAVSGADVGSLLRDRADAATTADINSETDLVLFPRQGSQMEIAEGLQPQVVACWIGNNDALGAVLASDHLDASQLTPIPQFEADFTEIVLRLQAIGAKVVFGTIPDVTRIAYLIDNDDLVRFLGSDHGLPEGSWTTLPTLLGLKLGLVSPSILSDPNYVLDAAEAATISARIAAFNNIIRSVATAHGMAVADTALVFDAIANEGMTIAEVPITTRMLGGLFSLDGVHPSNFGQGLAASVFIDALNAKYGLNIAPIDWPILGSLFLTDPFIDRDGDGRVSGRFGYGVLETIGSIVGLSGDTSNNLPPAP